MKPPAQTVLISINTVWNIVNFRSGLITALREAGYEVVAAAPPDAYVPGLEALGCRYVPLPMDNTGTHPGRDALLLLRFMRILSEVRPAVFLGYTAKPNIYGSLAARLLGIPVINNITGLGATFIRKNWLTQVVKALYRLALSGSRKVFFQNTEDRDEFLRAGLVDSSVVECLPGSGIDLARFVPAPPHRDPTFRFLLISRLLWDKGVAEFVQAAHTLRPAFPGVEFQMLGFLDPGNALSVGAAQLQAWTQSGDVTYLGASDDVRPFIARADCIVLPSYREGVPRALLEAAAMERPIVTTDAPGCREVVHDGVNGLLCRARDAQDLALKMQAMVQMPASQRQEMGRSGRARVESAFDERLVIQTYVRAIEEALTRKRARPG